MTTKAPVAPPKKPIITVPEEQPPADSVWTRYSPHGELQLSSAGSFALHALGIGIFIMMGLFVYGGNKSKDLPIEVVKLSGGGRGAGTGIGDGIGNGSDREDGAGKGDGSVEEGPKDDGALALNPKQIAAIPQALKDDPDAARAIQKGHPNVAGMISMSESARKKLRSGLNTGGNGGSGNGGLGGGNDGDGTGGEKGRKPNDREKRMFRWRINFERGAPANYLDQLSSMGAILGVPLDAEGKSYQAIRDFKKRPAKLLKEDPMTLGMICWFNNDPAWASAVMSELRINMNPSHFVVFFPRELEQKFVEAEVKYKGRKESDIAETWFRLRRNGNKYEPYVDSQTAK